MFPHRNIHKYTWTSPDGKAHKQINHVLIGDGIPVYNMYEFSRELTHSDQYLVVAKLRERLAVIKKQHRSLMGKNLISGS